MSAVFDFNNRYYNNNSNTKENLRLRRRKNSKNALFGFASCLQITVIFGIILLLLLVVLLLVDQKY